jgi:ribosomal protein S18 acetylase RimI-like enzyme
MWQSNRDWFFASDGSACGVMRIDPSNQSGSIVKLTGRDGLSAVVRELEDAAKTTADSPEVPEAEQTLSRLGWDPGCRLRCFGFDFASVAEAPWVRAAPAARGCSIVPWTSISSDQRSRVRALDLSPFPQERYLEPACSLALVHQGEVAGWSISTRDSNQSVYIAVIWVREDLQGRGAGASLIAETLRRGWSAGIRSATFEVEPHRTAMLRFADRHLRPYLSTDLSIYRTWKTFP